MYLVFEGIDGSYKSTICEIVYENLSKDIRNTNITLVSQPAGTEISNLIREITKKEFKNEILTTYAETMLFLAARSQLFTYKIEPTLQNGGVVISDRCNLSTIAYQSYKGGSKEEISKLILTAPWFRKADILFIVDLPYKVAESRIEQRGLPSDHLEKRLKHCEKVYLTYNTEHIAYNVFHLNGLKPNNEEFTSAELAIQALEIIKRLLKND